MEMKPNYLELSAEKLYHTRLIITYAFCKLPRRFVKCLESFCKMPRHFAICLEDQAFCNMPSHFANCLENQAFCELTRRFAK